MMSFDLNKMRIGYCLNLLVIAVLISLFFSSCQEKTIDKTSDAKDRSGLPSPDHMKKDTFRWGESVPAKGLAIDPDLVSPPERLSAGSPTLHLLSTHVHQAGKAQVVPVPKELPVIIPGKGGTALPEERRAQGKIVPSRHPKPAPAKASVMKDNALGDFQLLGVEQGLASVFGSVILEDRRGNIWFASGGGGICRYDGQSFSYYTEQEGLPYSSIQSIIEDRHGNLWIGGDRGSGISRYDGARFINFAEKQGFSPQRPWCMLEDSRGDIWIGTRDGGAVKYNGTTFTYYTKQQGLSSNEILAITEDSKGNLWFGMQEGGAMKYDGIGFTHYSVKEGLSGHTVKAIVEDGQGRIWFGTFGGGLSCLSGDRFLHFTTSEGLSSNLVESIVKDGEGNLWIGTNDSGLNKFNPRNGGSFTHYTMEEGLSSNNIQRGMMDSKGNLWFMANGVGVVRYNGKSFFYERWADTPRLEDKKGNLIADYPGGIRIYDESLHRYTQIPMRPPQRRSYSSTIMQDSRGDIWIGIRGEGLRRYDGENTTYYTTRQGLSSNDISVLMEDSHGNIWIGTHNGGVNRFEPVKGQAMGHITQFSEKEGLIHNHVHAIAEDNQGNIWIGTDGGGVCKYDGQHFTYLTKNEGLTTDQVNVIFEDSQQNIWIGTWNGGLNIYNGASFTYVDKTDGLSNNIIQSIVEDSLGRFWVSTEQGLNLLIPDTTSSLEAPRYHIISFGKDQGFNKVNVGSGFLGSKNRIWWPGVAVDLNQFELGDEPPRIQLNYVELEQAYLDYRRLSDPSYSSALSSAHLLEISFDSVAPFYNYPLGLRLPHHINHLTFHFSGIDWKAPRGITYQFMLEGLEDDWNPATSDNKADYRNIPPGRYTFKVKAASQTMAWSEPVKYSFTILPPWWLTWWAYCLYVSLIVVLLLAVRKYELKRLYAKTEMARLKELDLVKTRLYTNITHEFRTPLTIILGMANQMAENPKDWFREGLQMIRQNGQNLLNLVNQMLDLSKLESNSLPVHAIRGDMVNYLKYLMESFHSLAKSKDIQLHFHTSMETLIMDYDPEKILNILSNLLSNAIKFTPQGGHIYLEAGKSSTPSSFLEISIQDSGVGIPEHLIPRVFDRFYQVDPGSTRQGEGTGIGLALTKELVKLLGGEITVESTLGKGTTFAVTLPITQNAPLEKGEATDAINRASLPLIPPFSTLEELEDEAGLTEEDAPLLLIIEDNADVVRYLVSLLGDQYRLRIAGNGQEGIDKAIEMIPDIIISDLMMPLKDGFEVCNTLKLDERTSHIPIILLTAKADDLSRVEGLKRGADAYLTKPFNKEELFIRLLKLVELRQQLQSHFGKASGMASRPQPREKSLQIEDEFLKKVKRFLVENLSDENYGIEALCDDLGVSRVQLHRKLKALTNQSASHFIRTIRLHKGKELLEHSDLNVSQVAYEVGFKHPTYFTRLFLEEFGVTPRDVRPG